MIQLVVCGQLLIPTHGKTNQEGDPSCFALGRLGQATCVRSGRGQIFPKPQAIDLALLVHCSALCGLRPPELNKVKINI